MLDGDKVHDLKVPGRWWAYHDLDWWLRASQGRDDAGHPIRAEINDGKLLVRHYHDGRMIATWFTCDELNHVGGDWDDGDVVERWAAGLDGRR